MTNAPNPYGPPAGRLRLFNAPPGTLWLSAGLVIMFLAVRFGPRAFSREAFNSLAFVPQDFRAFLSLGQGELVSALLPLVGHAALHFDWLHLVLNVGFLLAFGSVVERHFGLIWFLILFALTAAAGALLQFAVDPSSPIPMIGASGAVYGMMGGAIPALMRGQGAWRMSNALTFIGVMMLLNLVIGVINNDGLLLGAPIAWQAHIGGFLAGLALCYIWEQLRGAGPRP